MQEPEPKATASAAAHRRDAFEQAVRRHARGLYRYCLRRLGDAHLAEDAVQETFMRTCRAIPSTDLGDVPAFLFGVARRCCLEMARRRSRPAGGGVPTDDVAAPSANADPRAEVLEDALASLTDGERSLIYLKHADGRTCREIAEMTGRPLGTVTGTLSRIYARLRAAMAND